MNYSSVKLDPRRSVRGSCYTWILSGRLGNSLIPHVFIAMRCLWALDKNTMRLNEIELAAVQMVPGGRIEEFLDYLEQFELRIRDQKPASYMLLADVSISVEVVPALWRKTPNAIPCVIVSGYRDEQSFPMRFCGRAGLLSRLQLYVSDRKLVSALPAENVEDPNVWHWELVRNALSNVAARPPKPDEDSFDNIELLEDCVVLGVAMGPWVCEDDRPSPYNPPELNPQDRWGIPRVT